MNEVQRLLDRIEQLEAIIGVDRSLTTRLREVFKIEPLHAQMLGMLLSRDFVTRDGLYTVLYEARPESEWPDEKHLDTQICKLRAHLMPHGILIETKWGEGWKISREHKAKVRALMQRAEKSPSREPIMIDLLDLFRLAYWPKAKGVEFLMHNFVAKQRAATAA